MVSTCSENLCASCVSCLDCFVPLSSVYFLEFSIFSGQNSGVSFFASLQLQWCAVSAMVPVFQGVVLFSLAAFDPSGFPFNVDPGCRTRQIIRVLPLKNEGCPPKSAPLSNIGHGMLPPPPRLVTWGFGIGQSSASKKTEPGKAKMASGVRSTASSQGFFAESLCRF